MASKEKKPCPHCGREFVRLWQHRCTAVGTAAASDVNEDGNSPGDTTSTQKREKQPCPTCGREFQRLSQHKCPAVLPPSTDTPNGQHSVTRSADRTSQGTAGGGAVNMTTREKQPCPTCGREFERLWQHKCPAVRSGMSADSTEHGGQSANEANRTSRQKQPCPTCGKEFERLWQHKCPAIAANASDEMTSHAKSPGGTAKTGTKEKQPCPTCGREFERLWQHKCPKASPSASIDEIQNGSEVGNGSSRSVKEKQPCPTCGREFERLWQHKCPNASSSTATPNMSDPDTPLSKTGNRSAKEKQPCPTCGREFERLWQHKCPNASPSASIDETQNGSETGNGVSRSTKEKQPCPTCGREFERLWQHKCPNASSSTATPNMSDPDTPLSKTGNRSAKEKQPCPTCGREFERLWQHKCPNANSSTATPDMSNHDTSSSNAANRSTKVKQPCPTCGREFERLWQHKCPALTTQSSAETENQQNSVKTSTSVEQTAGNTARMSTEEKQPCPYCGQEFLQLSQHKCPAADYDPSLEDADNGSLLGSPACEETVTSWGNAAENSSEENCAAAPSTSQLDEDSVPTKPPHRSVGLSYRGARSKVKSAQHSDGSTEDEKQACKWCGKPFKRLYQHKCKVVTMPPPSPEVAPMRSDPSSPPLTPAQDSRGYLPVIDTSALEEKAQKVMEALHLLPSSNPNGEAIAFFDDEVKLERKEIKTVFDAFNPFRRRVQNHLHESTGLQWDILNSGSSYDGTKVTRADEVDCMFIPPLASQWFRVTCENAPPGFCFLEMTSAVSRDDPCGDFLLSLCDSENRLSSQLFRDKAFDVFRKAVKDERRAEEDPNTKPDSLSFAVLLKAIPRSSSDGGPGLDPVSIDLVPALKLHGLPPGGDYNLRRLPKQDTETIRKDGCHAVPKKCPDERYKHVSHLLWRFSFSQAEKELTKFADSKLRNAMNQDPEDGPATTCRKLILRILKRFLEIFKGVDNSRTANPKMRQLRDAVRYLKEQGGFGGLTVEKFTTFQIRTLLWTEFYVTCPDPVLWGTNSRRSRFIRSLEQLKKMVSGRMHVSHFFVPDMDIMAEVPKREREFLYIMIHIAKELF